jgi:hypothetical protein
LKKDQRFEINSPEYVLTLGELDSSENLQVEAYAEVASVSFLYRQIIQEEYVPVAIFSGQLAPLQALVKYLKEDAAKTNTEISALIGRDVKTIWLTYKAIKAKKKFLNMASELKIPVSIFRNPSLSILESLIVFLRNSDMNYSEIGRLLLKDPRTIWTCAARAIRKQGGRV